MSKVKIRPHFLREAKPQVEKPSSVIAKQTAPQPSIDKSSAPQNGKDSAISHDFPTSADKPTARANTSKEQETNIHGFIHLLDIYMGICQVHESMAARSGIDKIVKEARSCPEETKEKFVKEYSKFLKEVQNKKPSAVPRLKELFTSWWGIMGAMPRTTLTRMTLEQEQEKDKRIFHEKKAAFETEFLF
jgi:hypothetical protein